MIKTNLVFSYKMWLNISRSSPEASGNSINACRVDLLFLNVLRWPLHLPLFHVTETIVAQVIAFVNAIMAIYVPVFNLKTDYFLLFVK